VRDLAEAARVGRICSDGRSVERDGRWTTQGDPMEAAIDVLARRLGVTDAPVTELVRHPFDPRGAACRTSAVAVASGAAFTAVVVGQLANAFAWTA
jgi:magnesium-transporting ATPase (P-type)